MSREAAERSLADPCSVSPSLPRSSKATSARDISPKQDRVQRETIGLQNGGSFEARPKGAVSFLATITRPYATTAASPPAFRRGRGSADRPARIAAGGPPAARASVGALTISNEVKPQRSISGISSSSTSPTARNSPVNPCRSRSRIA